MKMPVKKISRLLIMITWGMLFTGIIVLLVAAVRNNSNRRCKGLEVSITGVDEKIFIDEDEVKSVVIRSVGSSVEGKPVSEFDLHAIEKSLKRDTWVKEAKLFFDNNEMFRVKVVQREPVARIFTRSGYSFYVDNSLVMLPLSDLFSARVPVFTGFPADQKVLRSRDSLLLRDIRDLSVKINGDSVISAMIEQVEITPGNEFEMIPKLGEQVILFGDASDAEQKFSRMLLFYREMLSKGRLNRYSRISLKFKDQVVATVKGMEDVSADSVRTTRMVDMIAARAEKMAGDTSVRMIRDNDRNNTDVSMIQQSVERDVPAESAAALPAANATANNTAGTNTAGTKKPVAAKPADDVKPAVNKPVPKPAASGPSAPKPAAPKKENKQTKATAVKSPAGAKVTMPESKKKPNKN